MHNYYLKLEVAYREHWMARGISAESTDVERRKK